MADDVKRAAGELSQSRSQAPASATLGFLIRKPVRVGANRYVSNNYTCKQVRPVQQHNTS